ncbi:toll/interleukin-1 receptor domain-containing protein [Culturomica massiliensis]|uniref:toll/interleukin-1 receptor domain-containing protein n=1 Tax=Culturomica massiliensis TaxID=1841857 RepID=UPI00266702C5|nr:toll/interleukin-1 receptor domain-containing protein [Culturomica massiliensis]
MALMDQLMTADEQRKDVIIYSLAIQILKHFSVTGKTVIHMLGRMDLSSIELEDLDKLDAALNCIDDTIVIICTQKNIETPKVDYVINKSLKGHNNNKIMESRLKKVYISYKHDKNYDEAMEAIKRGLKKNDIYYSIDMQDIKYRDDIVKYEKEIGSADKVIMFITAPYLKSIDCMFEMTEIFKNEDVKNRVFPVVDLQPIPRNRDGLKEIKDFWLKQKVNASVQMQTESGNSDYVINELSKINTIIKALDEFWDYLVHINTGSFMNLLDNDAVLLMEEIQRAKPRKTAELDERIVSMGETQPTVIRRTTQNGEKSIYVENNTGTININ